jgi:hypothetical protein
MSKHKHVETAAHASNAVDASPPEAAVVVATPAAVVVEAPVTHAAVVTPEAAPAPAPAAVASPAAGAAGMASKLYGAGVVWAQKGIGLGKTALEGLARALDRTAQRLGELQSSIKASAEKSAA